MTTKFRDYPDNLYRFDLVADCRNASLARRSAQERAEALGIAVTIFDAKGAVFDVCVPERWVRNLRPATDA